MTNRPSLAELVDAGEFARRHIGPSACPGRPGLPDVRMPRVTATIPAPAGDVDAIERDPDLTAGVRATEPLDDAPGTGRD